MHLNMVYLFADLDFGFDPEVVFVVFCQGWISFSVQMKDNMTATPKLTYGFQITIASCSQIPKRSSVNIPSMLTIQMNY